MVAVTVLALTTRREEQLLVLPDRIDHRGNARAVAVAPEAAKVVEVDLGERPTDQVGAEVSLHRIASRRADELELLETEGAARVAQREADLVVALPRRHRGSPLARVAGPAARLPADRVAASG
jgi:hypothetical protein